MKNSTHERNCPSTVLCIVFKSVTHFTHTDIKTVVKCWYDVDMSICMSFSGVFCRKPHACCGRKRRDSKSLDHSRRSSHPRHLRDKRNCLELQSFGKNWGPFINHVPKYFAIIVIMSLIQCCHGTGNFNFNTILLYCVGARHFNYWLIDKYKQGITWQQDGTFLYLEKTV